MAAALEPLASAAAPAPSLEELWRAAWESHGGALHAYLRRRLPRHDEADDLLQETFVRAIRARAGGLAPESIRAYLFTTAHRLLIDRAQRTSEMLFSELGDDAELPWIQVAAPATDSPELATRRRRFAERLSAALEALAHALECPSCGEFYRAGKRLATAVAAHLAPPAEAPEESWERVQRAVGWRRSTPTRAAWVWRAAAVLAVGVGGWWLAAGGGAGQRPDVTAPEAVSAASDTAPSQMTDQRFAQLAGEVLAAEPRYRQALLGALETVGRRSDEGAGDEYTVRSEAFRPLVGTTGRL